MKASIIGGSGYTGGELLRLLSSHSQVEVENVTSRKNIGKLVSRTHPHLRNLSNLKFSDVNNLTPGDIAFICLPPERSFELIDDIIENFDYIVDLSSDYRLIDTKLYSQFYGKEHPRQELLEQFHYGLVEINREKIKKTSKLSSAGCNATASILPLKPILENFNVEHVVIDVKVGTSEGGRDFSLASHHPERSGSVRSYKPINHRHQAEILQYLPLNQDQLHFSSTSLDMVRGVLATIHVITPDLVNQKDLWKIFRKAYQDEPFIRIVNDKSGHYRYPEPKILAGTNYCDISFIKGKDENRIVLLSAIDNLVKGSAGQAIQGMNLMLGFEEEEGLLFSGLHPI